MCAATATNDLDDGTHWLEAIAGAPLVLAEIEERHDARTEGENPLADLRRKAEDGN